MGKSVGFELKKYRMGLSGDGRHPVFVLWRDDFYAGAQCFWNEIMNIRNYVLTKFKNYSILLLRYIVMA